MACIVFQRVRHRDGLAMNHVHAQGSCIARRHDAVGGSSIPCLLPRQVRHLGGSIESAGCCRSAKVSIGAELQLNSSNVRPRRSETQSTQSTDVAAASNHESTAIFAGGCAGAQACGHPEISPVASVTTLAEVARDGLASSRREKWRHARAVQARGMDVVTKFAAVPCVSNFVLEIVEGTQYDDGSCLEESAAYFAAGSRAMGADVEQVAPCG